MFVATLGAGVNDTPALASSGGGGFTLTAVPLPGGLKMLQSSTTSVACAAPARCVLVLGGALAPDRHVLAAVANVLLPSGLTTRRLSAQTGNYVRSLGNVACASASDCVAAGSMSREPSVMDGLFETYGPGGWTPSPAPNFEPQTVFTDVACSSVTCVADGSYTDLFYGGAYLAERDADGVWTQAGIASPPSMRTSGQPPNRYRYQDWLFSPACAPDGPCYTLGYQDETTIPTFLYRSGDRWSTRLLPVPAGVDPQDVHLGGMACAAALNCAAIGTYVDAGADQQHLIAEMFRDGQLVTAPIPIPASWRTLHDPLQPRAISCPAVDRCVGVIGFQNSTARHGALIVTYDGTRWTSRIAPAPTGAVPSATDLTGIACTTVSSCVTVGTYRASVGDGPVLRPLVESYTAATGWQASALDLPADVPAQADTTLADISCTGTTCLADGRWRTPGPHAAIGLVAAIARG